MPELFWNGEPIFYRRAIGFGLVIGGLHYRFDRDGKLVALDGLTQPVLNMLLEKQHGGKAGLASAAFAETPIRRLSRLKREFANRNRKR